MTVRLYPSSPLLSLRAAAGLTQAELAALRSVDAFVLASAEGAGSRLRIGSLARWARAAGLRIYLNDGQRRVYVSPETSLRLTVGEMCAAWERLLELAGEPAELRLEADHVSA
jgi:hypothetical protein